MALVLRQRSVPGLALARVFLQDTGMERMEHTCLGERAEQVLPKVFHEDPRHSPAETIDSSVAEEEIQGTPPYTACDMAGNQLSILEDDSTPLWAWGKQYAEEGQMSPTFVKWKE